MLPLLIALPFGPFLAWKRGDLLGVAQRLMFAGMLAAVVLVAQLIAAYYRGPWLAPFGVALGVFVMAGAALRSRQARAAWRRAAGRTWRRFMGQPRSA